MYGCLGATLFVAEINEFFACAIDSTSPAGSLRSRHACFLTGVFVAGVDQLAHTTLHTGTDQPSACQAVLGLGAPQLRINADASDDRWKRVLNQHGLDIPQSLRNVEFLRREWESIILPGRVKSREGYCRVRRPAGHPRLGRGL